MRSGARYDGRMNTRLLCTLAFSAALSASASGGWQLESSREAGEAGGVRHVVKTVRNGEREVELQFAFFETPKHHLRVVDRPGGTRVAPAVKAVGGLAGINGGYFHPAYKALGLIVTDGEKIHDQEKARLLSGVVVSTADRLLVLRPGEFKLGAKTRDAVQAGPFLIDGGAVVRGLSTDRQARRSVLLTDGKNRHAILATDYLTLAEAATVLATAGVVSEWPVQRALNLDGGSSTGFYFSGGAFDLPNLKQVRNVLAIVPGKP